jgi:hypothetical protein
MGPSLCGTVDARRAQIMRGCRSWGPDHDWGGHGAQLANLEGLSDHQFTVSIS